MAFRCEVCGKGTVTGNNVSHSNSHSKRTWKPNLQNVKINDKGTVKKIKICTRCLRSGKVERTI